MSDTTSGTSGMGTASRDVFQSVKDLSFWDTLKELRTFTPGEVVMREGDPGDCMYIIRSGMVEITLGDQLLDILTVGEIIGEMSLLDGSPRSATITTLDECTLVRVSQEGFKQIATTNTEFFAFCMKVVSTRLRRMNEINTAMMRSPPTAQFKPAQKEVDKHAARPPTPPPASKSAPPKPTEASKSQDSAQDDPHNSEMRWN